jgi:hypothetical protein
MTSVGEKVISRRSVLGEHSGVSEKPYLSWVRHVRLFDQF